MPTTTLLKPDRLDTLRTYPKHPLATRLGAVLDAMNTLCGVFSPLNLEHTNQGELDCMFSEADSQMSMIADAIQREILATPDLVTVEPVKQSKPPVVVKFAVYRIAKDGSELNYSVCSDWFASYEHALDAAQSMYEKEWNYRYEVRDSFGKVQYAPLSKMLSNA
jgi:hypothetical protein